MKLRFLGILFIFAALPAAAGACVCASSVPGQCPGLQASDVVFLGTVTDAYTLPFAPPPTAADPPPAASGESAASGAPSNNTATPITRYHFHIDERFAGAGDPEIDIFSGGDDGDCGYRFQKDKQYIVYTHRDEDGRLFATICNGTRLASDGAALLPQLRAMRDGKRVASVFGVLRHADPPFLSPPDAADDPVSNVSLKLRSKLDRFQTDSGEDGVFSFYDVHAGDYDFTASLPPGSDLTQRSRNLPISDFQIPDGACYEYNVDVLPTGEIHGVVLGPDGKPLPIASLELFRAGTYSDGRPGYWGFQGATGSFAFDHIGPGQYILVYNRANRMDPNSPFPRMFYPGVASLDEATPIVVKEGQQLLKVNFKVTNGYPSRLVRVHLKWDGDRPSGSVTVAAKADKWENPSAEKIGDGVYQLTIFDGANYTISAWEDVAPPKGKAACTLPPRLDAGSVTVPGADATAQDVTLVFPKPECAQQAPAGGAG